MKTLLTIVVVVISLGTSACIPTSNPEAGLFRYKTVKEPPYPPREYRNATGRVQRIDDWSSKFSGSKLFIWIILDSGQELRWIQPATSLTLGQRVAVTGSSNNLQVVPLP